MVHDFVELIILECYNSIPLDYRPILFHFGLLLVYQQDFTTYRAGELQINPVLQAFRVENVGWVTF